MLHHRTNKLISRCCRCKYLSHKTHDMCYLILNTCVVIVWCKHVLWKCDLCKLITIVALWLLFLYSSVVSTKLPNILNTKHNGTCNIIHLKCCSQVQMYILYITCMSAISSMHIMQYKQSLIWLIFMYIWYGVKDMQ